MKLPKDATIYPFPSAFNEKELDAIGHAIGYEVGKVYRRRKQLYFAPHRNYYYCNADDETWNGLVKKGFAEKQPPNKDNCSYFSVTNECLAELTLETSIYFYSENARGNEIDAKEDVIEVLLDHAVYCGYGCWIPPGARQIASAARLPYKLTLETLNYLKKCGYVNHFYEGGIDDEGFPHCTHGWSLSKKWTTENNERYIARQKEEYKRMDEISAEIMKEREEVRHG